MIASCCCLSSCINSCSQIMQVEVENDSAVLKILFMFTFSQIVSLKNEKTSRQMLKLLLEKLLFFTLNVACIFKISTFLRMKRSKKLKSSTHAGSYHDMKRNDQHLVKSRQCCQLEGSENCVKKQFRLLAKIKPWN